MIRIGHTIKKLLSAFGRSQRGNVAMMTGVALPVLLMVSAGAIDLHNMARVKSELQDALDAASLAAARSPYAKQSDIQRVGMDALRANMPGYFQGNPGDIGTFIITGKDQVTATATVQVKTIVANIFLPPYGKLFDDYMPMSASSEVLRASRNVEVAMALDITGSMSGQRLTDLKAAAKELIGIVVQEDQTIYTTRMALVPYAAGVNMGDLANTTRGTLRGPVLINAAAHGQGGTITNATSSHSNGRVTITRSNHNLESGDTIVIKNGSRYETQEITRVSNTQFRFNRSSNLSSGFEYRKCEYAECAILVTVNNHGLNDGDRVKISGVNGLGALNGTHNIVRNNADTFFVIPSASFHNNRSGGGSMQCGADGCQTRLFMSRAGSYQELPSSDCVSERARGSAAPSEAPPTGSNRIGRSYLESANACPSATFRPLSSQLKGTGNLYTEIDGYKAGGSTAGQVGIEVAWYALSPEFTSVFDENDRANPYNPLETVKAAVLMTDGEFNTPFCQGVIANNAGSGSGNTTAHINCASTNGDPFKQALQVCEAMKQRGIVVYTVAFGLGSGSEAANLMRNCATSADNFHDTSNGTDLKEAFKAIGRDITRLRIAR